MDGPLYIAVAQQRDNAGELYLGSPVFIYNQRNYNAQLELFPLKKSAANCFAQLELGCIYSTPASPQSKLGRNCKINA